MWHQQTTKDVLSQLGADPIAGLSGEEAARRLEQYGKNQLPQKKRKSLLSMFLAQLQDTMIYILLAATLLSIFMKDYAEAIIILIVVFLNAVIGVFQENKAEQAMEALKKLTTPKAYVRRDGEVHEIPSEDIVPGDVVEIDAGRYIPADLRLIESSNLQIEESALTGESVPSQKDAKTLLHEDNTPLGDRTNMAFMSTLATYGRGVGVVVANAKDSEIGKIAKILEEDHDEMTPLQKRLDHLGRTLGMLCLGVAAVMLIVGLLQAREFKDMLLTAISLAVAAIPEGLPAIVAIVLALGVTRLSKNNAIVKKLPSVETLGSVNVICSDKTGTLTQNKMTVVQVYTYENLHQLDTDLPHLESDEDEQMLIKSLVLCSDATANEEKSTGDPTEIAFIVYGNRSGLTKEALNRQFPRVSEKPFDSDRKLMSTCNREENGYVVHTKGAVDQLLKLSTRALHNGRIVPMTNTIALDYLNQAEAMSDNALRVLGAAYKSVDHEALPEEMEEDLIFLGMVGMIDPPRLEVHHSVAVAKRAGIRTIMITGDHKNTAVAIAKELGIASGREEALTGVEIDALPDEEFSANINKWRVFARVSPEHKVKIVRAFKSHGNIVSMTGDGVNDAPSLKFADIGVAMGITGTDVSKGAADMILTDDNFTTIVHAVEEGRNIYANIKKAVIFLLSCNLGEVVSIFLAVVLGWPIPLLATQILWVNLITDTLPAISLGMDPGDPDAMAKKPRDPKESFFSNGAGPRALVGGLLIGFLTLVAFVWGLSEHGLHFSQLASVSADHPALPYARTMAFVVLAGSQLFYSLSMRHPIKSIFQVGFFKNKYLLGSIVIGFMLQLAVIEIPFLAGPFGVTNLQLHDWLIVLVFSILPQVVNELIKAVARIFDKDLTDNEF
ncbi:Cation transport ATPase [Clostridiaceae bacterium JG1575]|nr:Cation transport ATPase [Clostridiaceae bacterium JG1575]